MKKSQPKLLYVAEVRLPGPKASGIHVMRMCKAMADQGYSVKLLAIRSSQYRNKAQLFDFYGVSPDFEVQAIRTPGKGRLAGACLAFTAFWNALIIRPYLSYTRAVMSAFAFSLSARAFVFEAHSYVYAARRPWLTALFHRFINKRSFVGMVVISEALKQLYCRKDLSENDMFVAHDGADEKPLDKKGALKGGFAFNAGYFGSVFKGRGIEVLIKMAEKRPEIGFHIFGGRQQDLKHQEEIPPNLIFYGFVSPSIVHIYRNACDVLLAPYQPEVFVSEKAAFSTSAYMSPLKIFEYMSARKAMIVSDMPVLREVLSPQSALLVSPNDTEEWLQALDRLQREPELRTQLREKAYHEFLAKYTWHRRAMQILEWLSKRVTATS